MFFSPELLARRDSGFGLLWMAATLGSKSTFKKLPKKSVMTADISQLCDLITEPGEPLALRLSSNLMYGVARVYKVKQEIFLSDVTTCVSSLKKMLQEMHQSAAVANNNLLLAHPIAKDSALNIQRDSENAYSLIHDTMFTAWDPDQSMDMEEGGHVSLYDDNNEETKGENKKSIEKARPAKESIIEKMRKETHTLDEHHEYLLSASFDKSFEDYGSTGGVNLSSSQADGGFIFDDDFFGASDGFELAGDIGDELAKELGWEITETQLDAADHVMDVDAAVEGFDISMVYSDGNFQDENAFIASTPKSTGEMSGKENMPRGAMSREGSATSFSKAFLSQDQVGENESRLLLEDITTGNQQNVRPERKRKRARLLLDARTELTDEELKVARAKYVESQKALRKEIEQKTLEKNATKMVEGLIWGAPQGIFADPLVQFWQDKFRIQVQARSNMIDIYDVQGPPRKRAKNQAPVEMNDGEDVMVQYDPTIPEFDMEPDGMLEPIDNAGNINMDAQRRSSEEPGQARRNSRASSIMRGSQFDIELEGQEYMEAMSQKSMFPWDNAGASSSAGGHMFSDHVDFAQADIRLRSGSLSRRESSLIRRSRSGSILSVLGASPAVGAHPRAAVEQDMVDDELGEIAQDSQRSEVKLATLEKNSSNFLEYAKMQQQANPKEVLKFETIVPSVTSTRHVAAAAFYHCLVLVTKNLVNVKQVVSYGPIVMSVV